MSPPASLLSAGSVVVAVAAGAWGVSRRAGVARGRGVSVGAGVVGGTGGVSAGGGDVLAGWGAALGAGSGVPQPTDRIKTMADATIKTGCLVTSLPPPRVPCAVLTTGSDLALSFRGVDLAGRRNRSGRSRGVAHLRPDIDLFPWKRHSQSHYKAKIPQTHQSSGESLLARWLIFPVPEEGIGSC